MSPVPLSLSRVQIAMSSVAGTPNWRSMRARSEPWRSISCVARLTRAGMTRVAAYSSKLLRKVPRWRRSKASTAGSSVRPAKAPSITARETPAAPASRPMADRNALKSPPHGAAAAGVAKSETQNRIASERNRMPFPPLGEAERHIMAACNKEMASRSGGRYRTNAGNRSPAFRPNRYREASACATKAQVSIRTLSHLKARLSKKDPGTPTCWSSVRDTKPAQAVGRLALQGPGALPSRDLDAGAERRFGARAVVCARQQLAAQPEHLGAVEALAGRLRHGEALLNGLDRLGLVARLEMHVRREAEQVDHEVARMNRPHRGDRLGSERQPLRDIAVLGEAPAGDPHAPGLRLREIVLGGHPHAQFRVRGGERHVAQHLGGRGGEIKRERQRKWIVETFGGGQRTVHHGACRLGVARKGERQRAKISRAAAGVAIAIARRQRAMNPAVEQGQRGVGVGTRLGELAADEGG